MRFTFCLPLVRSLLPDSKASLMAAPTDSLTHSTLASNSRDEVRSDLRASSYLGVSPMTVVR